ncbi:uncharacterized protein [Miscanthus floridulus]|uniref:uncharacterized protein n=1 Tax=Miscanthus floridulus TaxID=154761 RepID=UPI0034589B3A
MRARRHSARRAAAPASHLFLSQQRLLHLPGEAVDPHLPSEAAAHPPSWRRRLPAPPPLRADMRLDGHARLRIPSQWRMPLPETAWLALRLPGHTFHGSSVPGDSGASLLSPSSGDGVHSFPGVRRRRGAARPLPQPVACGFPSWSGGRATRDIWPSRRRSFIRRQRPSTRRISGGDSISRRRYLWFGQSCSSECITNHGKKIKALF